MKITKNMPVMTKGEAATLLYPGITCDCALPQHWVDEMQNEYEFDVRPSVVWGYPAGSVFGIPLPLTLKAADFLADIGYGDNDFWCRIVTNAISR